MQILAAFILGLIRLLLGIGLLLSIVLICANAFGRYVLAAPIIWAEEILGFALVWMVYLGAVQVTRDEGHLSMDLLLRMLPSRWQAVIELIGSFVFVAVAALILYQAYFSIAEFTHHSQIASLPMNVMHSVIPASFLLMAALVLMHGIVRLRRITRSEADGTSKR